MIGLDDDGPKARPNNKGTAIIKSIVNQET